MVGSRVYVGGLPYGTRERDLEKFFKGYGRTRDILIKNGYGFVEFEDYRDADDAVYELNGKELLGERSVYMFFHFRCYQPTSGFTDNEKSFERVLIYSFPMCLQAGSWWSRPEARPAGQAGIVTDTMIDMTDAEEAEVAMIGECLMSWIHEL